MITGMKSRRSFGGFKVSEEKKKRQGRPVKNEMPPPIPDTPENIARAIMQGPPKKEWDYLKKNS